MSSDWSSDVCRSEEHTSELQSHDNLVCRLLLEKKKKNNNTNNSRSKPARVTARDVRTRSGARAASALCFCALFRRSSFIRFFFFFFFFNDTATPEIYPLSLPDALPISGVKAPWSPIIPSGPSRTRKPTRSE